MRRGNNRGSDLQAFARIARRRYRIARNFGVPRLRAVRRALDDAITEELCGLIVGHDFTWDAAGLAHLPCSYCQALPTRGVR